MEAVDVDIRNIPGKHRHLKLSQVYDMDNLIAAEKEASRGKHWKYGVRKFERNRDENLRAIQTMLMSRSYHSSVPKIDEQFCACGKVRKIVKMPYCPDHIIHHALMRVIGPSMNKSYYFDSYASIVGKGTEFARKRVRRFIDLHKDRPLFWAKTYFKKFYENIDQGLVYMELCKMYHDDGLRWLLKEVVTSVDKGLGIGLYPIQPIANFYLNKLDRLIGEMSHAAVHLFRYCDDMLLIGFDSKAVWKSVEVIRDYAQRVLMQPLHTNVNVLPVTNKTGVDFVGYVFYRDYTFIRKSMKERFRRKVRMLDRRIEDGSSCAKERKREVLASYKGWLMHCNGKNLWEKITNMKKFSDLNISSKTVSKDGKLFYDVPLVSCGFLLGRNLIVKGFLKDVTTKNGVGRYVILVEEGGRDCKFMTNNPRFKDVLEQCESQDAFPFEAVLKSRTLSGNKIDYYFE